MEPAWPTWSHLVRSHSNLWRDILLFWDSEFLRTFPIQRRLQLLGERYLPSVRQSIKGVKLPTKNEASSSVFRLQGNQHFAEQRYTLALERYNESVLFAPVGSLALGLALSNRAASLLQLGDEECAALALRDTTDALRLETLTDELRVKLAYRQAQALLQLGHGEEARQVVEAWTRRLIDMPQSLAVERASFLRLLSQLPASTPPRTSAAASTSLSDRGGVRVPLLEEESRELEGTSSALEMFHEADRGRGLRARRAVREGELLLLAEPYAAAPSDEAAARSLCQHCFVEARAPLPCLGCARMRYCSERCRDAQRPLHALECGSVLPACAPPHLLLVSRLLLRRRLESTSVPPQQQQQQQQQHLAFASRYDCIASLVEHSAREEDAALAMRALEALQVCAALPGLPEEENAEELQRAFYHLSQLPCNAIAITRLEARPVAGRVETREQRRVSLALFATPSLLNHSCRPNAHLAFAGSQLQLRAAPGGILPGREVCISYGPDAARMETPLRQRHLSQQYHFLCRCEVCCEPEGGASSPSASSRGEPGEGERERLAKVDRVRQSGEAAFEAFEAGETTAALERLERAAADAEALLGPLHSLSGELADRAAMLHARLSNWRSALHWAKRSLLSVEARFGARSVEAGNEYMKLAQLAVQAREWHDAVTFASRALDALRLHLAEDHPDLSELRQIIGFASSAA